MPSSYLILWASLLLLPSIFHSIRDFSNESSVRIRWTEEPSGLQSMRLQRVRHEWRDLTLTPNGRDDYLQSRFQLVKDHAGCHWRGVSQGMRGGGVSRARGEVRPWELRQEMLMALAGKKHLSLSLLATPWTIAHQASLSMGFPTRKNTGVGCHLLLQGIFPTQGWNPRLLHCRQIPYHWATVEAQWEADLELKPRTVSSLSTSCTRTSHFVIVRIVSRTPPWVSRVLLRSFQILVRFYDPNDASWHPPSSLTECLLLGTHLT